MKRTVEPELMSADEQAKAYAAADFAAAHDSYLKLFAEKFPDCPRKARVLDLACGPCDVTIRFAKGNLGFAFHAVDGSAAMLKYGRRAVSRARLSKRIRLIEGFIPGVPLPHADYDVILSSSFLHHLHDPQVLWQTVRDRSQRGTIVFIADLRRPGSRAAAKTMVRKYSSGEPEVLRRDFLNSLLAAFTPSEVRKQLKQAGLTRLTVEIISNRHLIVTGRVK